MNKLTGKQRRTALTLRNKRDAAFALDKAQEWHNQIVAQIHDLKVPAPLIFDFCDICGVDNADVEQTRQALDRSMAELNAQRAARRIRP